MEEVPGSNPGSALFFVSVSLSLLLRLDIALVLLLLLIWLFILLLLLLLLAVDARLWDFVFGCLYSAAGDSRRCRYSERKVSIENDERQEHKTLQKSHDTEVL